MSRRPHYCYYHSRFREEASKCKTSESGPRCEFQKLKEGINRKMVPDWRNEEYLYKRRADTEENVEGENLFTRKSDEENYVIHVSEAQKEEPNSSRDLMSEANEYCVYSSQGFTYENITRTIKNDYYFDRPLDEIVGDRYRRQEPNHGIKEREAAKSRSRRPCSSTKKE